MKRIYPLIIIVPGLLWLAGCGQTQPDILENIFFTDDEDWLDRNYEEDPYERVDGRCCNDDNPHPLPIDTTIRPVIAPAGDLDYFDIQITADSVGYLFLDSERDNIRMRLFNRELDEYELPLDTCYTSTAYVEAPFVWTILYGQDSSFTLLIKGKSRKAQGNYTLGWQPVILVDGLQIEYPRGDDRWRRSNWEEISWNSLQTGSVGVALLKGPIVVQTLKSGSDAIYMKHQPALDWRLPDDLEAGKDYRIMVYFTDNPRRMNISDEFEIY